MARDRFVDFLEGAMRGGASALRGYMQAKVNVAKARNEHELQRAQIDFNKERNALLRRQQDTDVQIATMREQGESERHQATQETARFQIYEDAKGRMYKVDSDNNTAMEITRMQTESAESIEDTRGETARDVADSGLEGQKVAAEATKHVADKGVEGQKVAVEGQVKSAEIAAGAQVGSAEIAAQAQRDVMDVQKEIAMAGYASQESIAKADNALKMLGFMGLGQFGGKLDADGWKRLNDMLGKVSSPTFGLKRIQDIRGGYLTGMQGFLDATRLGPKSEQAAQAWHSEGGQNAEFAGQLSGINMADMAMINGFQRMIDPGATVREGDVDALLSSMGKHAQFQAWVQNYLMGGGRLTPEARRELASMILSQYNTAVSGAVGGGVDAQGNPVPGVATSLQTLLKASGLEQYGIGMDFFNLPQIESRTLEEILQQGVIPQSAAPAGGGGTTVNPNDASGGQDAAAGGGAGTDGNGKPAEPGMVSPDQSDTVDTGMGDVHGVKRLDIDENAKELVKRLKAVALDNPKGLSLEGGIERFRELVKKRHPHLTPDQVESVIKAFEQTYYRFAGDETLGPDGKSAMSKAGVRVKAFGVLPIGRLAADGASVSMQDLRNPNFIKAMKDSFGKPKRDLMHKWWGELEDRMRKEGFSDEVITAYVGILKQEVSGVKK